jgi:hypothetical protein
MQGVLALLSNSKHSGVPEDPKSPTLGVGVSTSHFTQSGVATKLIMSNSGQRNPKLNVESTNGKKKGELQDIKLKYCS